MSQVLHSLSSTDLAFPNPNLALSEPNGLLAVGGDLSPQRLLNAYSNGIFPWYSEGDPLLWWSPDPRTVIPTGQLRVNKTLRKFIKKSPYHVTINTQFERVINLCADAPFRDDETWILDDMVLAYNALHKLGYAHSIEVWDGERLVGGLYGVAINGLFSGESMFYLSENASKVALIALRNHLASQGIRFIDCQLQNPFLESMGAIEISRDEYFSLIQFELSIPINDDFWQPQPLKYNNE